jgi:hypothetical protein
MAGLLGQGWDDPKSSAIMALAGGLLQGNLGGGLLGANQAYGDAKANAMRQRVAEAQLQETLAQAEERKMNVARQQEALRRQQAIQAAIPTLYKQPGMTGGQPVPQEAGGVPMFSQPMGAAPMQQTPGGFDVQAALRLGMDPKMIQEYAGLQDVGRPKATRQMEVDDGKGGKRIALVDDFGREVAGFAGYTAPVQVNQGDRVSFVKPAPGVALPVNMSPEARASNALGWANHGLSKQRLSLDQNSAAAGKAPLGYRFKPDGALEAIPGGPADIKAGEIGAKAEARQKGAIAQADSVLQEVRDAKKMVSWNTAGVGGTMSVLPATEARDLAAKLQTVKANLGFDRLQQMRDQSPTGGALGSVAQQELAALQATVASLDQMQSPVQLGKNLDKIEMHYTNWRNAVSQAAAPKGGASGGWDIREKK